MSVPQAILDANPGLNGWCILHAYRGSIAHGMYEPPTEPNSVDDKDTMAVCVPPMDHYCGLREFGSRGTQEIKQGEWDIVVYEARKALRMLAKGNPNILCLLWMPESGYIHRSGAGQLLIDNRQIFACRHVYHSFVGYAHGQLHKMTHGATAGYMGIKRREIVERFGYDTKNAAHLIRLLRVGIEFLREGYLRVDRGGLDATELLDIKHGEWSLADVQNEATRLFRRAEAAYDACKLPEQPDPAWVNDLCAVVVWEALKDEPQRRSSL